MNKEKFNSFGERERERENKNTEKLETNETIYYTCPHQAKMTEPNCKICLNEAEEELKRLQEEKAHREEAKKKAEEESKRTGLPPYTESENLIIDSVSNQMITTPCFKCGIVLKHLSGNYFKHQGITTNIKKQIETKHCQPEQIAEYQNKLKEKSSESKLKELTTNLLTAETAEEKKTQQEQKTKLQKQQNFILGGILVSLVGLIGIGVY